MNTGRWIGSTPQKQRGGKKMDHPGFRGKPGNNVIDSEIKSISKFYF